MTTTFSDTDRNRFKEIKNSLVRLGPREHTFSRVELLFFEALDISREYGSNPDENKILADLIRLQEDAYQKTRAHTQKSSQSEMKIRRFMTQFKRVLSQL